MSSGSNGDRFLLKGRSVALFIDRSARELSPRTVNGLLHPEAPPVAPPIPGVVPLDAPASSALHGAGESASGGDAEPADDDLLP